MSEVGYTISHRIIRSIRKCILTFHKINARNPDLFNTVAFPWMFVSFHGHSMKVEVFKLCASRRGARGSRARGTSKMSPVNVTAEYDQTLNGRSAGQGGMTTCNASVIPVSFVWGYSNSFFTELDYSIFFEDD